ncbi:MAG: dihydropteroate synthase [Actinobacteria bacterium]|jgi:dihydropteroate synthase|nr:dihydropteroate synthase [Actinomycetota bacterium]
MKNYDIFWANHHLKLGPRTCVMGILNITPDSFSDGGKFFAMDRAISQAEKLVADGADILDVGGESTRPFSDAVSEEEETRRVVPVIETIAKYVSIPISIDTTKSGVAKRAIEAGASIINDVGALRMDADMAKVAAASGVPVILMHMLGTPKTMQVAPEYGNLLSEIRSFLATTIDYAVSQGILRSRIIIDPGIGFGKTINHNLMLIRCLSAFASLNAPVLIGPSRKSFIRNLLKATDPEGRDPSLESIETGTQAIIAAGILNGAHILRVHDVARTMTTLRLMDAMKEISDASCD